MRPDNPMFRPCWSYSRPLRNGEETYIGFDCVGPGWEGILNELDHQFVMITGIGTSEHTKIKILQIKEKFGTLRVYPDFREFDEEKRKLLQAAVNEAEAKSAVTCEACGQPGTSDGPNWAKTFCAEHHRERKETGKNPLQKIWEARNGGTADTQVMRPRN